MAAGARTGVGTTRDNGAGPMPAANASCRAAPLTKGCKGEGKDEGEEGSVDAVVETGGW